MAWLCVCGWHVVCVYGWHGCVCVDGMVVCVHGLVLCLSVWWFGCVRITCLCVQYSCVWLVWLYVDDMFMCVQYGCVLMVWLCVFDWYGCV